MEIVDMAWSLVSAVLGVIIGAWLVKRMVFSREKTLEMAKPCIEYVKASFLTWIQTEQAAKLLYQVGGVIASGAKSGFGLNPRGGKFKIEDIIGQLIGKYAEGAIQKFLPQDVQQTGQAQSSASGMDIK